MKRFIALMICAATLLSLCSCFGENNTETEPEDISNNESFSETGSSFETDSNMLEDSKTEATTESETETETESDKNLIVEDAETMNKILNDSIIFKFGSSYALIKGKRIKMENAPFFTQNALYPADFIKENGLATVDESTYLIEHDGINYVTGDVFLKDGKQVHIFENDGFAIITSLNWNYGENADEAAAALLHKARNLYSIGTVFSAKMTGDRPVLFVTDEMLAEAKKNAADKSTPQYKSWILVKTKADAALSADPQPDTGSSATAYRLAACKDLINAKYLALAYLNTEDSKYLDGALRFLLAYAEPMLGTDKYLDYSAPTTDGQADIGLNIAAPLTTACDVYSLIYPYIEELDRMTIEEWIEAEAELCIKGHEFWIANDYYGKQYGNNHLSSHLMGIIAAAYVLEDDSLLEYALLQSENAACLTEMITRAILMKGDEVYSVDPDSDYADGEIYDRYRSVQNNGFGYSIYHLKFLTHSAMMLYNNGIDVFGYYGENGENLQLPYHTYSEYLIKNDITLGSGHYTNDRALNRENAYSIYTIAYYIYKDEAIKRVLDALAADGVICNEIETFGNSTPYLFGVIE